MAESVEQLIRKILSDMNQSEESGAQNLASASSPVKQSPAATVDDYPVAQKHPEWIKIGEQRTFDQVTMEDVLNGSVTAKDFTISPDILKKQGEIAAAGGRAFINKNFSRAAELTRVPDARLLEMYNALRPYRSSKEELLEIANELEQQYQAPICAGFFREAAEQYERRKKLKGDN